MRWQCTAAGHKQHCADCCILHAIMTTSLFYRCPPVSVPLLYVIARPTRTRHPAWSRCRWLTDPCKQHALQRPAAGSWETHMDHLVTDNPWMTHGGAATPNTITKILAIHCIQYKKQLHCKVRSVTSPRWRQPAELGNISLLCTQNINSYLLYCLNEV